MKTFERLKFIRKKTGLTQKNFADMLGEKPSRINSIEGGKQIKFPYDLAEKILKTLPEFNYSFRWITTGEGAPFIPKFSQSNTKALKESPKKTSEHTYSITNTELTLLTKHINENKELTILVLKKLHEIEKNIKNFLLEN